ncbi:MAG: dethiobiotin synthase [Pelosinus sp.]|nr:dethiobiotin synthase [Pelosinus sp.]
MGKGLFVTGTDTDVGKTFITGAIAAALKERGRQVGVVKPVASGGIVSTDGRLLSEDASFLMWAAGFAEKRRQEVNVLCLEPALTPAVAAQESNAVINIAELLTACRNMIGKAELTLVEGVGGLVAPIWQDYLAADMPLDLKLPAILVARPNLGTVNHTVLSVEYARQRGIKLAGIVINQWPEAATVLEESNAEYIEHLTKLPILGRFPTIAISKQNHENVLCLARLAEKHLAIDKIIDIMKEGENNE